MFFSVIVPCYNSEEFLSRIFSTLSLQSFNDFEAIFIDDFSTDSTYERLSFLVDNAPFKCQLHKNELNLGPGVSKGKGVSMAQGKYILFMDSDDWFEANAFQILYERLSLTLSDIVFFDAYRTYESGKKVLIQNSKSFFKCKEISDYVAVTKGALPFMCFNNKLWDDISIPSLYNAEDIAVIPILISKATNISILPIPLYNYYYRTNSISNKIKTDVHRSFLKSFDYTYSVMCNLSYKHELEFHGIKTVLYGALLNGLRANITKHTFNNIISDFTMKFPSWKNNRYIRTLSIPKRIYLQLVYYKMFYMLHLYVFLHRFALNVLKK